MFIQVPYYTVDKQLPFLETLFSYEIFIDYCKKSMSILGEEDNSMQDSILKISLYNTFHQIRSLKLTLLKEISVTNKSSLEYSRKVIIHRVPLWTSAMNVEKSVGEYFAHLCDIGLRTVGKEFQRKTNSKQNVGNQKIILSSFYRI